MKTRSHILHLRLAPKCSARMLLSLIYTSHTRTFNLSNQRTQSLPHVHTIIMQFLYFLLLAPLAAAQTGREPGGARSLSCCQIDRIGTAPFFINTRESDYTMSCCGRYEFKGKYVCVLPLFLTYLPSPRCREGKEASDHGN